MKQHSGDNKAVSEASPTDRELDVLKTLWRLGEARVRDVHEAMSAERPCAFTTVQTLLKIMADKGLVTRRLKGRTSYYRAKYSLESASSRFLHKVFDGALDRLVLSMLRAEDVSPEELRQLERLIGAARREKQRGDS